MADPDPPPPRYFPLSLTGTHWLDRRGHWHAIATDPPTEDEPGFPEPHSGERWYLVPSPH